MAKSMQKLSLNYSDTYTYTVCMYVHNQMHNLSSYNYYMQVNTNGVISFDSSFTSTSVYPFPRTDKIIAPYWADLDTRGTGHIFYRQTTDPTLLARASTQIQAAYHLSQSIVITNLFIATWDAVGYYDKKTDKVKLHNN